MSRTITRMAATGLASAAALALAAPASAQGCSREMLQGLADSYIEAQTHGEPSRIPMGNWVVYRQNFRLSSLTTDLLSQPMKIDWHRALLDTTQCRVSLEIIITDEANPYVLAVQFNAGGGSASNFNVITSGPQDWLFDAKATYEYARREDWSPIPEERQNTREELRAAADAYLDLFSDKSVQVPWGMPCNRLEGGIYTGRGTPEDSCDVGVPEGVAMDDRRYVIDPVLGAVDVQLRMGENRRPDSHRFRIEDGKIRYVHTVTNCGADENCGFPPFADMLARNPDAQPDPALFD